MRRALLLLPLLSLSCGGCDKEAPKGADAGAVAQEIRDEALGLSIPLLPGWSQTSPEALEGVRTIARAVRAPSGRRFLVAPRLVVTEQPTDQTDPLLAFRITQADLKAITKQPGVELTTTSMGQRAVGRHPAADLEIAYKTRIGGTSVEIAQRSLVIFLERKGQRALVTLSASYMAKDAALVGQEVQQMFVSATLK